jgi:hypothetical protein
MWAIDSGKVNAAVSRECTYFTMARDFNLGPEAVDKMPADLVDAFIFMDGYLKEKRKREDK